MKKKKNCIIFYLKNNKPIKKLSIKMTYIIITVPSSMLTFFI